ncbi:rhodanese-like domain-containing protein [Kangiella sp. M94]
MALRTIIIGGILLGLISPAFSSDFFKAELEVCSIDDEEYIHSLSATKFRERKQSYYMDLNEAVVEYQKDKLVVIDVRPDYEYKSYRIPKSLNMTSGLIKRKGFLKNKNILLVNDGIRYTALEMVVDELLASGFKKVSILDGGVKLWARKTSYVDGQIGLARSTPTISVKNFLAESRLGSWLVVDVGSEPSFKEDINGKVIHLPLNESFTLNLSNLLQQNSSSLKRVLFASNDADMMEELNKKLNLITLDNYFVLDQTIPAIEQYKKESLIAFQKRNKKAREECQ